jgi:hypothetical protein
MKVDSLKAFRKANLNLSFAVGSALVPFSTILLALRTQPLPAN